MAADTGKEPAVRYAMRRVAPAASGAAGLPSPAVIIAVPPDRLVTVTRSPVSGLRSEMVIATTGTTSTALVVGLVPSSPLVGSSSTSGAAVTWSTGVTTGAVAAASLRTSVGGVPSGITIG